MIRVLYILLFFQFCVCTIKSQNIRLIQDLNPGFQDGYFDDALRIGDEVYFNSFISGFQEIYRLNSDLEIEKVLGFPEIWLASNLSYSDNSIYFYGEDSENGKGIFSTGLASSTAEFLSVVDNDVDQQFSLSNGVVYVTEDFQSLDKTIYYFEKDKAPVVIATGLNLGSWDVEVSEIAGFIIITPFNDEDYNGGIIVFNKDSGQMDDSLFDNLCDDPRFAYGFESVLIYSCNNEYFAFDLLSEQIVALPISGSQSLKANRADINYTENKDFIFLYPQWDRSFLALRKSDLNVEELSQYVNSFVDMYDDSGLIYFAEDNFLANKLYQSNGSLDSKIEILTNEEEFIKVKNGASLMDKTHLLVSYNEFVDINETITVLNENNELINIEEIKEVVGKPVFETLGSAIIFTSDDSDVGTEFFALQYPLSNNEIKYEQKELFYPTLSFDGVLQTKSHRKVNIEVWNENGQKIGSYSDGRNVTLPYSGVFYIIEKNLEAINIQKVVRI